MAPAAIPNLRTAKRKADVNYRELGSGGIGSDLFILHISVPIGKADIKYFFCPYRRIFLPERTDGLEPQWLFLAIYLCGLPSKIVLCHRIYSRLAWIS